MDKQFNFGTVSWSKNDVSANPFLNCLLNQLLESETPTSDLLQMVIYDNGTACPNLLFNTLKCKIKPKAISITFEPVSISMDEFETSGRFQEVFSTFVASPIKSEAKQLIDFLLSSDKRLDLNDKDVVRSFGEFPGKKIKLNLGDTYLPEYLAPVAKDLNKLIKEINENDPTLIAETLALKMFDLQHRNYILAQPESLPELDSTFDADKISHLVFKYGIKHPSISGSDAYAYNCMLDGLKLLEMHTRKRPIKGKDFQSFIETAGLTILKAQHIFGISSSVLTQTKKDTNKEEVVPFSTALLLRCLIRWPYLINLSYGVMPDVDGMITHLGKQDKIGPLVGQSRLAGHRWSKKLINGNESAKPNDTPTQRSQSLLIALQQVIMTGKLSEYIEIVKNEASLRKIKLDL